MLNKLTANQLKVILIAMGTATIKGSDAVEYAKIIEIVDRAHDKKVEKELQVV